MASFVIWVIWMKMISSSGTIKAFAQHIVSPGFLKCLDIIANENIRKTDVSYHGVWLEATVFFLLPLATILPRVSCSLSQYGNYD